MKKVFYQYSMYKNSRMKFMVDKCLFIDEFAQQHYQMLILR